MATRLYVTARPPGTRLTGPPQGAWSPGDSRRDNRGDRRFVFLLSTTKVDGGVVPAGLPLGIPMGAGETKTANQPTIAANLSGGAVWVSPTFAGSGTISGTLDVTLRTLIPAGVGAAAAYLVHAYITQGDTLSPRATILNSVTGPTAWTTTVTWRTETFALAAAGYQAGDRIVVEIGAVISPSTIPVADNVAWLMWGTTDASDTPLTDAANGDTATQRAAWVEFSSTLAFDADRAAAPANDACADATVIPAVPYDSPVVDATGSADTGRSLWWTWTAPANQRVFVTARGGNAYAWLRGWQGGCGSLSLIHFFTNGSTNATRLPWDGASQTSIWFDAIAGTQYWFQVASTRQTVGANAAFGAKDAGGAVQLHLFAAGGTPQPGDLYVDCQDIVVFRGGLPINQVTDFYGLTPTGNAIDYSGRPLEDQNGGTHTGERLYIALFGSSPTIEILDLETLNVGELEIDYIFDAINAGSHGENLSTIVFDLAGNLILGWYGDAYSVLGALSSPDACAVRRLDATHADNQAGAPWPAATAYTVVQESGGSDFTDLAIDQDTIYYTSAGQRILRYSLSALSQLADYAAAVPSAAGPRPGNRGIHLLPPGDGSTGALVAAGQVVYWIGAAGTPVAVFTPSPNSRAQDLDKIEIDPDGQGFWVSDQLSTSLFHFDLATGAQTQEIITGLPAGQLCGFNIYDGYRAGGPPPSTPPAPPPPPPNGGGGGGGGDSPGPVAPSACPLPTPLPV